MKKNYLSIIILLAFGLVSKAQFSGLYDPSNWTFTAVTAPSIGNVNTTGAPAQIVLSGDDDGSGGCCNEHVLYSIDILYSGTISFDYSHVNFDIDNFYYTLNNTDYLITASGSGSLSVPVNAGDNFGFKVISQDDCCGQGVATISNFSGPTPPINDDAGIAAVLSPSIPSCDLDSIDIEIVLTNMGMSPLTSCDVKWQIGSGTPTNFAYTGNVPSLGGTDTVIISANNSFSSGSLFKIWTENPNGSQDSLTANDTVQFILEMGLAGTYSIPGDYANLNEAKDALMTYGVCDHVIMEIANGVYNEQVEIGSILGTSENATVTFTSQSGSYQDVHIEFDVIGSTDNYVVYLNGADWVRFTDVTIENLEPFTYGTAVRIEGGAENNIFERCHILAGPYQTTSNSVSAVFSNGLNHNLSLIDNKIEKGGFSIYINGGSTNSRVENVVIEGNNIKDGYYWANYLYYIDGLEFNNNKVHNDSNLYLYDSRGVYCYYVDDFNVTGNYIGAEFTSGSYGGYAYPLYFYYCLGNSNPRSQIANNCVIAGAPGVTQYGYYGLYMDQTGFVDLHNNTINRLGGYSGYYAAQIYNGGLISVKNNSFADYASGYAFYTNAAFNVSESDHNNYHTNGGNIIYANNTLFNTFASYQSTTGLDPHGINVDPVFADTFDCATCNDTLNDAGTPIVSVSNDIDGNLRNTNTPDIGAKEFLIPSTFTLGPDSVYCADQLTLQAGPGQTISWFVNGFPSNDPTVALNAGNEATEFEVIVTINTEHCGSVSDDVEITLVPNANLVDTHICADASVVLNPGGPLTADYSWSNGATSQNITVSTPGVYTVTKIEEGCESSATSVVSQSEAVEIPDTYACEDDLPMILDATILDGTTYTWSGGASPNTSTNAFNDEDVYGVTVTDIHGCVSSDSFEFSVIGAPQPEIHVASMSGTIYVFDATTSGNYTPNSTVQWNFGVQATPQTSTNPIETVVFPWSNPSAPASYYVTLVVDNGCDIAETTELFKVDPLAVTEVEEGEFALFPNPAIDEVTIVTNIAGNGQLTVFDLSGRIVSQLPINAGSNNVLLNVDHMSSGSYIIQMTSESVVKTQQLIVQ